MADGKKTVLLFGDSQTWGCIPDSVDLKTMVFGRYDQDTRWGGVLQARLGAEYRVIEEALNGRTTVFDDPLLPGRNGQTYLYPCLLSHYPLDLVVIMLGTNDLKPHLGLGAAAIAKGVRNLIKDVKGAGCGINGTCPEILLMAPPPIVEGLGKLASSFMGAQGISEELGQNYALIAELEDCHFLRAGNVVAVSKADGLHLDAAACRALGEAVAAKVREIFGNA